MYLFYYKKTKTYNIEIIHLYDALILNIHKIIYEKIYH